MDIGYRIPYPLGIDQFNPVINEKQGIELKCEIQTATIHYTLDGTNPGELSPIYKSPLILNLSSPVEVKAVTIMPSGRKSSVVSGVFEKVDYSNPEGSGNWTHGINFNRYDRPFSSAYDVKGVADSSGVLKSLSIPAGKREQFFGVYYNGLIEVPSDGIYTFSLDCDDGALLYIDSRLVVDNDGFKYGGIKEGKTALEKGKHHFGIKYFQAKYGYSIALSYRINNGKLIPVKPEQFYR